MRDLGDVTAIPVAFRYEFVEDERPEAFVAFGKPWRISSDERVELPLTTSLLEQLMEYEMDVQREEIMEREFGEYQLIVRGKRSVNNWWDSIRHR